MNKYYEVIFKNVAESIYKGMLFVLLILMIHSPILQFFRTPDTRNIKLTILLEIMCFFVLSAMILTKRSKARDTKKINVFAGLLLAMAIFIAIAFHEANIVTWGIIFMLYPVAVLVTNRTLYFTLITGSYFAIFMSITLNQNTFFIQAGMYLILTIIVVITHIIRNAFLNIVGDYSKHIYDLEILGHELENMNITLEERVEERTIELENSLEELQTTQKYLMQSEKLLSIGTLVTGISHEINTPIGVGITSSSYLKRLISKTHEKYASGKLSKSEFEHFFNELVKGMAIVESNLNRGAELVENFKQIGHEQSQYPLRKFKPYSYFDNLIHSFCIEKVLPNVQILNDINPEIDIVSYPGVLSQIIYNLLSNSTNHAFFYQDEGVIHIGLERKEDSYLLHYSDNGCGMDEETLKRVFDPFYKGDRAKGGPGLGMYIIFCYVANILEGEIHIDSSVNNGLEVLISFPKKDESMISF